MNDKIQIDLRKYKSQDTKKLVEHLVELPGIVLDFPIINEGEDRTKQENLLVDNSQDSDCLNKISPCKEPKVKRAKLNSVGEVQRDILDLESSWKVQGENIDQINVRQRTITAGSKIKAKADGNKFEYIASDYNMNTSSKNRVIFLSSNSTKEDLMPKNYAHFIDEAWIINHHEVVNGRLQLWKEAVEIFCDILEKRGNYPYKKYQSQLEYAKTKVPQIQAGIAKQNKFPVCILNDYYLSDMVYGIDLKEDCKLVRYLSNCQQFNMHVSLNKTRDAIGLSTRFDDCYETRIGY